MASMDGVTMGLPMAIFDEIAPQANSLAEGRVSVGPDIGRIVALGPATAQSGHRLGLR